MANEITEIGQIVTYAGPTLTLAGSDIASNVISIQSRQGSGSARGWRTFDPTKQPFLNTLTQLVDGDKVLVVAKTLPMNFPVKGDPGTVEFEVPAGSGTTPAEIDGNILQTQNLTYTSSIFTNQDTGVEETGGTVQFRLDGGSLLSYDGFNTAVAAINVDEIKAGLHTYSVVASVPSNNACYLNLQ